MKKFSKILSVALLVALVLSLGVANAFADGKTITLNNPSNNHTYTLYQVFTGTFAVIDGDDTLGDLAWGSAVTPDEEGKVAGKTATETADSITNSEAGARAFANSFDANLVNVVEGYVKTAGTDGTALVWDNLSEGYYIIKDTTANLAEGDQADLVVVQVLDNVEITAKAGTVEFDKEVEDRNDSTMKPTVYDEWGNTSDYDVGDDVPYQVTIKLPANFTSYETYTMTVHDKMDAGLSFNGDVVVKLGDATLTAGTDYTVTAPGADDETFDIVFSDVKAISGATDNSVFTVTYSAKLTGDNVVYGNPGNKNEAWLTYSNNPVTGQEGGTTPHKITVTFTYKLEIDKVDGEGTALDGAAFKLEKLVMAEDGTTSWTELGLVEGASGTVFTFNGLDDGQYRITETETPSGYNSIQPIYFSVVAVHTGTLDSLVVKQTDDTGTELDTDKVTAEFSATLTKVTDGKDAGLIDTQVVNNSGATLPSTGGIGTTIFYVVGGVLVLAAIILLVTKKRMSE